MNLNSYYIKEGKVTDGGLTQKSWILPNGTVESFGSEFHYSFLLNNPKITKKYKIDISSNKEQPIRLSAIKNGLFRVNHEIRNGNLTIEGVGGNFNRSIKDSIIEVVSYAKFPINNITIRLFNNDATKVTKEKSSFVGNYDKLERVEHIPMVTEQFNMPSLEKWYQQLNEADGQDRGNLELHKSTLNKVKVYANSIIPNLDDVIPDFDKNFNNVKKLSKIGKTKRKDMPVITSRDVKLLQQRLVNGNIDINAPYSIDTDINDPFPSGLEKDQATAWLIAGLNDGDKNDDKINISEKKVKIGLLKPIQAEIFCDKSINSMYNQTKGIDIESTKKFLTGTTYYITSNDNYILDGHHRWLTGMLIDPSMIVNILSIDLPINILLPMLTSYGDAIGNKRNN